MKCENALFVYIILFRTV